MTDYTRRDFLARAGQAASALTLVSPLARALKAEQESGRAALTTIDLEIKFVGICLFVPSKDGKSVHALMPIVPPGSTLDAHFPIIHYNHATAPTPKDGLPLNNTQLTIPSADVASFKPGTDMYDVGALWVGQGIPARKTRPLDELRPLLAAHVIMEGATFIAAGRKGIWNSSYGSIQHTSVRFAAESRWKVQVTAPSGSLELTKYTSNPPMGLQDLTPPGGSQKLTIEFRNVIEKERAQDALGDESPMATHFSMFDQFYADNTTGPWLDFVDVEQFTPLRKRRLQQLGMPSGGVTPFTCMEGGGGFGP